MSKKELQEIIAKQQGELARYKTRLTDLVSAHKSLLKEKDSLEATVRTFAQSEKVSLKTETCQSSIEDPSKPSSDESNVENSEAFTTQLSTLMNSITTLSEEKSRMEASFQADKRQLRLEKQQLENTIKEMKVKLEQEAKNHHIDIENYKSKLIIERHQREKEHNDHGVMIRELQKVVAEERGKREKAESSLENFKTELGSTKEAKESLERKVKDLLNELEAFRSRAENEKSTSGELATKLHQQLVELKHQHVIATRREQERVTEAEERAKRLAATHEERVANLEARLAELSATVGNYDRLRQSDQMAIDRLKDRLLQLEMEQGTEKYDNSVDQLLEKVSHIKGLIEAANQVSEKPIDVKAALLELCGGEEIDKRHQLCRQEYDQLKLDFENYKKKFTSLSSRSFNRLDSNKNEVDSLKSQINALKDRVRSLLEQKELMESKHKKDLELKNQSIIAEREKYKEKFNRSENEWRSRIASLETQLGKQRERALSIVKEKENEIAALKESFSKIGPHHSLYSPTKDSDQSSEAITDGILRGSSVAGPVLHFSQELARRDVELTRLRKEKLNLESDLREKQDEVTILKQKQAELAIALQNQIDRFERYQSSEGANLEYLKNVIVNFLLSNDPNCKSHMLNAIGTVLKFTDLEKKKIAQHSWWYSTST